MDCSYGIGVANRYALFLDSEVDPDALNDVEDQKKDQEKPSKKQDKRAKGEAKSKQNQQQVNSKKEPLQPSNTRKEDSTRETLNKPPRRQQQQQQQQQPQQQDGDNSRRQGNRSTFNSFDIENKRPDNRRNRRPFTPRDDTEGTPTQTTPQQVDFRNERDSRERSERGRGFRGRGRGRGGYFGGRDNRGKREFERHSGSDKSSVKAQDKRDGAGSHNWGNVRDDVKEATNPELNTSAVSDDAEYANKTGDEATEPKDGLNEEEIAAKEAEAKQMSLDEYKAQVIMEREKLANKFNFRKAGEGEDQAQWKKTYVLKNKPDSKYDKAADDKFVREKISKPTVDIEIKFADTSRGGGRGAGSGPGRRGGGRGGGGRGRRGGGPGRGNNNMKNQSSFGGGAAPRMDDENDFPLLGK
ncbi:uncharacterized protein LOC100366783 isoform X2 [Saccoglossus kowalevskii]|uniref:Plasminogen activator inhibitor 1 RNA-binding protein-like isoform X1 n=1 Tax=Saccoglossus kowalevskii TaxID=10224 RepID=A0ABM0GZP4_SACKO|nr:PREDICTED: plasminogen activator inhibitor 1 RNA-binding protein-like isoform X1 [Saccoglossus kowalevskii]